MKLLHKGLLLALIHVAIVASLGAKLFYDRSTRPRVWAKAAPYDPDLPLRGRYVSLQLEVVARDITPPQREEQRWRQIPVILSVENDQLVARPDKEATEYDVYRLNKPAVRFWGWRRGEAQSMPAVLSQPVLFFIPENIQDPSRREPGEELWVEVTLPKKGPPRPIRLGVKRGDSPITPLDID